MIVTATATKVITISGFEIDSLSGVWIAAGTFIAYCVACLAIAFGRNRYLSWRFKKAREARARYQLTLKKDREIENENNS